MRGFAVTVPPWRDTLLMWPLQCGTVMDSPESDHTGSVQARQYWAVSARHSIIALFHRDPRMALIGGVRSAVRIQCKYC